MRRPRSSLRSVYGVPLLVGTVSAAGLIGALIGDGAADAAACAAVGAPLAVLAWVRRRRDGGAA